ncbi:MAG: 3',5'-cyclic-nucleotide phosphodiesterase [Chitinophagia bacterium]|jgi:3',5'-cyclic-nucleotide phosphodiesterase
MKPLFTFLFSIAVFTHPFAQKANSFTILPLGVKGGLDESNLSAYMIAAAGSDNYICLDAGTINAGLQKIVASKLFYGLNAEDIQKKYIKAYFISHAHLDHVAGLIMNSPNDIAKPIYALPSVIDVLKNQYFTWKSWANFGSEGDLPILNKYTYQPVNNNKAIDLPNTELTVTPFVLSHVKPYESTAFLIRNKNNYVLYLGDTGADVVEKSKQLDALWQAIAEKIKAGQLKAIFIEVSFDNSIPDKSLFGHLTPRLLMQEMISLNKYADGLLKNTPIYVTHIKPCANCESNIKKELMEANLLGLSLFYPEQGKIIQLH